MAKPNLALIPATIGDKVYSILPSDGVGDFDFTRATTATRINAQGLIEEVASGENRLNYSLLDGEVVGCPHLLLEDEATNLLRYSEEFSQSSWYKYQISVGSNSIISPNGTQNASKITINSTTPSLGDTSLSLTVGDTYTLSCFVKKGTNRWVRLGSVSSGSLGAWFDLENNVVGTVNSTSASIENYGNGWYRISNTITAISGTNQAFIGLSDADGGTSSTQVGNTVYVWGFQIEQGSYPTSYIKTNGEVNGVTRAAETANGSGNAATFNDSEGVLMLEGNILANDGTYKQFTLNAGNPDNSIRLMYTDIDNQVRYFIRRSASTQADITHTLTDATQFNKIAMVYKANDFQIWVNGIKVGTDTSGTPPSGLNTIDFNDGGTSSYFYGKTKQIQYFDSVLDSEQLEQLTSWDSFRDMAEGQLYTIE